MFRDLRAGTVPVAGELPSFRRAPGFLRLCVRANFRLVFKAVGISGRGSCFRSGRGVGAAVDGGQRRRLTFVEAAKLAQVNRPFSGCFTDCGLVVSTRQNFPWLPKNRCCQLELARQSARCCFEWDCATKMKVRLSSVGDHVLWFLHKRLGFRSLEKSNRFLFPPPAPPATPPKSLQLPRIGKSRPQKGMERTVKTVKIGVGDGELPDRIVKFRKIRVSQTSSGRFSLGVGMLPNYAESGFEERFAKIPWGIRDANQTPSSS